MPFETAGELAEFIRGDNVAPFALAALSALSEERRTQALLRCAAAFESAANGKGGDKILACSAHSIIQMVLWCATTDLYPGGLQPQVWIVPYDGVIQAQASYHGLRTAALRSGNSNIRARNIYKDEPFEVIDSNEGEQFRHERLLGITRNWDTLIGVYCAGNRPDGTVGFEMLDKAAIERRKAASKTKSADTPWRKWPEEMALKTAIRYAINRGTFPVVDRFELALEDSARVPGRDFIDAQITRPTKKPATAADLLEIEEKLPPVPDEPKKEPVPVVAESDGDDDGMPG